MSIADVNDAVSTVEEVRTRKELEEFIRFPERLHRNHERWVPPIRADERRTLHPKKNRACAYCDCTRALAVRDGEVVGRIVGIVNHRYNESRGERSARFSHLECVESQTVAHALLEHVEDWARVKGMTRVVGPLGFTDQDPEGFLVDGFEHEPTLATYYNFEYIVRLLAAEGYSTDVDYVVHRVPVPATTPELYERLSARIRKSGKFSLVEFERRKELRPYVRQMLDLMNESFAPLTGYSRLDTVELDDLGRRYLPAIDPRFVKCVVADRQLVGFIVAIPNMNDGFRRAKGRLLPFGWLHILRSAKQTSQLDLLLGAIREGFRGRGVDVLLGNAMMQSARRAGFSFMDSHHQLEDNYRIQREMEKVGGEVYKRFRIFQKELAT